jgi:sugar phosphate isomerase/epimerase
MLSLSTAWWGRLERPLETYFALLVEQGFRAYELNFVVHPLDIAALERCMARWDLQISSLHNICSSDAAPIAPDDAYGDNVAALDEAERRQSAGHLRATAETALRLGARAVVIHAGSIPAIKADRAYFDLLRALSKGQVELATVQAEMRRRTVERDALAAPHLPQLIRTLGEVCADFPTLRFGLESRYHYHSFPSVNELAGILDALALPNVGYWHDCGHAQFQENLGLCRHADWLERYGARLVGVHFHGMFNIVHDHAAPAAGNMPFELVRSYLQPDTIGVLELASSNALGALIAGRDYLERLLAFQPLQAAAT